MECSKWLTGRFMHILSVYVLYNCHFHFSFYMLLHLPFIIAVKTVNPSGHSLLGVLVGNKNEFRHGVDTMSEVTFQEGQQAAGELGLAYFETSAV